MLNTFMRHTILNGKQTRYIAAEPASCPKLTRGKFQYDFGDEAGYTPLFPSRFLVSRCTLDTAMSFKFSLTGLSPSLAGFPKTVLLTLKNHFCSPNPTVHAPWFGLFPFRSPLL